ncbi:radical SAM protein [bacterium]|nr:radical SAM protein [bacterium]
MYAVAVVVVAVVVVVAAVVAVAVPVVVAVVVDNRRPHYNEPFFLQWHITDKCPLNCKHCYRDLEKNDLDFETLLSVLDKFAEFLKKIRKKGRIQFAGGEPLVSPYLIPLIKESVKRGFPVRILSSGVTLTEEKARKIYEAGCSLIQISLEGGCDKNDEIRGTGNFDMAINAMKAAKANGIEVTVSMTVSKSNLNNIDEVYEIAKENADRFVAARLIPVGRGGEELGDQLLSKGEVKSVLKKLKKYREAGVIDVPMRDPLWGAMNLNEFFPPKCNIVTGCSVGYNGITIESNGEIMPCRRLPIVLGNILENDLVEVWKNSKVLNDVRDRDNLKGECGSCRIKWFCGGCRGIPYGLEGDYLGEDSQCFRMHLNEKITAFFKPESKKNKGE